MPQDKADSIDSEPAVASTSSVLPAAMARNEGGARAERNAAGGAAADVRVLAGGEIHETPARPGASDRGTVPEAGAGNGGEADRVSRSGAARSRPLCPSAQPDMPGSMVFAVVGGTPSEPRLVGPLVPTEVFRFAAPCMCSGCDHFENTRCRLVERAARLLPVVAADLPACTIRPDCRWWRQEGRAACLRCPQVVTSAHEPSQLLLEASASPPGAAARRQD
jgi:hypothetical protein